MTSFNTIEELKSYIKEQLANTDYTMLEDVKLLNKNDFVIYRTILRSIYFSDPLYITACLPNEPQPKWNIGNSTLSQEQINANNITTL
jgi:hypothetical protein